MARQPSRSESRKLELTLPKQTYEYLGKLAEAGALGTTEPAVAAFIVIREVERLLDEHRATRTL